MRLSRRAFGFAWIGLALSLAGCGAKTAIVIADLRAAFGALSAQLPGLARVRPSLAAKLSPYVTQGNALLANLSAASPSMTTDVATIDGILNAILRTAAQSGLLPPPYDRVIEALAVLAPIVEAFVNEALPPGTPRTAAASAPYPHPHVATIDDARATFAQYAR